MASNNLKKSLIPNSIPRQFSLTFHERTQSILDPNENVLQQELIIFKEKNEKCNLVPNKKKTVVMLFNQSRKHFFLIEFSLGQDSLSVLKVSDFWSNMTSGGGLKRRKW